MIGRGPNWEFRAKFIKVPYPGHQNSLKAKNSIVFGPKSHNR